MFNPNIEHEIYHAAGARKTVAGGNGKGVDVAACCIDVMIGRAHAGVAKP